MNYKRLYNQIVEHRKSNPYEGYTEKHHIIPRSLGGIDDEDNLVELTAREHFICHYLLAKMYPKESFEWYKMNHAFLMMKSTSMLTNRYYNSRLYEALRGNFSSVMSYAQSGKRNSQFGTKWISNIDLKKSKRIKKDEPLPNGWVEGRNVWKQIENNIRKEQRKTKLLKRKQELDLKLKNKLEKKQKNIDDVKSHYDDFINGNFNSMSEYARSVGINKMTLSKRFRKFIPEYKTSQGKSFKG